MTANSLIEQAAIAGVFLRIENGELKAKGNRDALASLADDLRKQKTALVNYLSRMAELDQADSATHRPAGLSPKLHAASVALDQAGTPPGNPDRWCWPLSSAMNSSEIALFGKRVDLFFYRDVPLPEAEKLADLLVIRDRERNTQHACFECAHLRDVGTGWRCNNHRQAGLTTRELGRDFAGQLQHCNGYVEAGL